MPKEVANSIKFQCMHHSIILFFNNMSIFFFQISRSDVFEEVTLQLEESGTNVVLKFTEDYTLESIAKSWPYMNCNCILIFVWMIFHCPVLPFWKTTQVIYIYIFIINPSASLSTFSILSWLLTKVVHVCKLCFNHTKQ